MHNNKREHLIDVALGLFAKNGYHATGIDTILKESGIAKKTLYRYFQSKEELIVAVLRKYDESFLADVKIKVETRASSPRDKISVLFDVVHEWLSSEHFYGCMFINVIGEYSEAETAIRHVCKDFKSAMRSYIQELCEQNLLDDPVGAADKLALVIEGAIVTAQVSNNPDAALTAKALALEILHS